MAEEALFFPQVYLGFYILETIQKARNAAERWCSFEKELGHVLSLLLAPFRKYQAAKEHIYSSE